MQLHTKKKVEIVIPAPMLRRILGILDRLGVSGYTVLRAISGKGHHSEWDLAELSDATRHVVILVVVADPMADKIIEAVGDVVRQHHGIIVRSTVEVMRSDYF
jgi:nitrogen regulatory protein PII